MVGSDKELGLKLQELEAKEHWDDHDAAAGPNDSSACLATVAAAPEAAESSSRHARIWDALQASLCGFGSQGTADEHEYQAWCKLTTASLADKIAFLVVQVLLFSVILCIRERHYSSAVVMMFYLVPLWGMLRAGHDAPRRRKSCLRMIKLVHWLVVMLLGLGLLPPITTRELRIKRMDIFLECVLLRCADLQAQLRSVALERVGQTFSLALLYSSQGMAQPILQSVAINALSLTVGLVLDVRNRHTYLQMCSSSAQKLKLI